MYNTIIAVGHLVKDPESRTTSTGKNICNMRLCISESHDKNKCFIDVESWEKTADACVKFLEKGREVLVEGSLCLSSWTGKDGSTQTKNYIKANKVKFLGGGKKDGDAAAPRSAAQPAGTSQESNDDDDDIPF